MKIHFILMVLLMLGVTSFSQNSDHPYVTLTERIKGKRLELFAVNTNSISYDVFLKVDTEDFRRSSARPVIRTIPANSEIRLITMVKLTGKEGNYSTTFVVNEIAKEVSIRKDHEDFDIKFDNALRNKEIILYTKDECDLCKETKNLLNRNKMSYSEFSIDIDSINLMKLVKEFKKINLGEKAMAPILKIDDSLYTKLKNREDLIQALKNHF